MIDIHCHILAGIDDGPATMEESVAMCRIAANDGITVIVATPHFTPGTSAPPPRDVNAGIDRLASALAENGISMRIVPGAEVAVTPELAVLLRSEASLSINSMKRYFLAELPPDCVPPRWDDFLLSIKKSGIVPILVHPERNPWFLDHPDALYRYSRSGGLVQVTAMSLTGELDGRITDYSHFLLKSNLVHVIATDAHSPLHRKPVLSAAFDAACRLIGEDRARLLVLDNPLAIIEGRSLAPAEPARGITAKRTWLQRLAATWNH